jgi:hypothetical protein
MEREQYLAKIEQIAEQEKVLKEMRKEIELSYIEKNKPWQPKAGEWVEVWDDVEYMWTKRQFFCKIGDEILGSADAGGYKRSDKFKVYRSMRSAEYGVYGDVKK